jgi:NAD(P)H-hydrate repair Nnr-like enzyme with NAD(P)H-hydrate dehydratase domain
MDGGWTASDAAELLRVPTASDDKYSRGVLGVRTGSSRYPGAAVLGVEAAWRTGLGMVRYVGPAEPTGLVLQRRPETVAAPGRVQAWVIGSGTDADERPTGETEALREILRGHDPVIVDAGALELAIDASAPVVVTPHARELDRLRAALGLAAVEHDDESARAAAALETAQRLRACVVVKGARTRVATPGGWSVELPPASAWLATAGTGDVLAGVIGAVVAGGAAAAQARGERLRVDDLGPLAATGAWVHARAAAAAVDAVSGGPITALDVAEHLSAIVGAVHAARSAHRTG